TRAQDTKGEHRTGDQFYGGQHTIPFLRRVPPVIATGDRHSPKFTLSSSYLFSRILSRSRMTSRDSKGAVSVALSTVRVVTSRSSFPSMQTKSPDLMFL